MNDAMHPNAHFEAIFQTENRNKLTKLGRCDRYTIEGLKIKLLVLLLHLGVQDC